MLFAVMTCLAKELRLILVGGRLSGARERCCDEVERIGKANSLGSISGLLLSQGQKTHTIVLGRIRPVACDMHLAIVEAIRYRDLVAIEMLVGVR